MADQLITEVLDSSGKMYLSNILDKNTGSQVVYKQTTDITTDAQADGVIFRKYKNLYFKRVVTFLYVEWFGAVGDGTKDDYTALQACFDMAARIDVPVHLNKPKSFYRSSKGLVIANAITVIGKDTSEIFGDMTRIVFDKSTDLFGINITSGSASAGTILRGFTIQESGSHKGGFILGYNSVDGKILYMPGVSTKPVSGDIMQARPSSEKLQNAAYGQFTCSAISLNCTQFLSFYGLTGTFSVGQTITAANGATMVILFVGQQQNVVCGASVSGTFNSKDALTTPTGSAFVDTRLSYSGAVVMDVSAVTGTISSGFIMNEKDNFKTGILMQRRAHISEMRIVSFSGCGGAVPGDISNINCFIWEKCSFQSNGYNGLNLEGTDSNAGNTQECTFVSNISYGINDISFLGNTHSGHHSSSNLAGAWFAGSYNSRSSVFLNCYSESSPTRYPFQELSSKLGGGAISIGGVDGVAVDSGSDYSTRGTAIKWNGLKNSFIDTYSGPRGKKLKVFAPNMLQSASALAVAAFGNQGSGRGVGIDFLGQNDIQTDIEYASMFATRASDEFQLQLKVREYKPYSLVIKNADGTTTAGSGAKLVANVDTNGTFTSVEVTSAGSGYATNSIITISAIGGETITTPAVLYPVIMDGVVNSVKVINGGAGYFQSGFKTVVEVRKDAFMPSASLGASLGRSTLMFLDTYTQRLRTGAGLQQITSGTGIPEAIVTATTGSKYYQTDGVAGLKVWIKDTGTTATGWKRVQSVISGTTALRPVLTNNAYDIGVMYTDTTLQKPVWWWGTAWKDATGATV